MQETTISKLNMIRDLPIGLRQKLNCKIEVLQKAPDTSHHSISSELTVSKMCRFQLEMLRSFRLNRNFTIPWMNFEVLWIRSSTADLRKEKSENRIGLTWTTQVTASCQRQKAWSVFSREAEDPSLCRAQIWFHQFSNQLRKWKNASRTWWAASHQKTTHLASKRKYWQINRLQNAF